MPASAEHQFIAEALHKSLSDYSETRLMGPQEADRRKFDYGAMLLRDFSRPLVSQVLWSHEEGIDKDIRSLLFDAPASLKVYLVRDTVKNRARIDEVLTAFRNQPTTAQLLRGFSIIPIPDEFDADTERHQIWMQNFLKTQISNDLLFAVVFGKLTAFDVATFSDHGGPIGLKYAALQQIVFSGLQHGPSFEKAVGSRGSALREVLTMLSSIGLAGRVKNTICRVPTLKGRFLLDLSKRLKFEHAQLPSWTDELTLIMSHLNITLPKHGCQTSFEAALTNPAIELIHSMDGCKSEFGRDLLAGVDANNPTFYSTFLWKDFIGEDFFDISRAFWDDRDDLDLFGG